MRTILLTGVAGFIGYHTAKHLLERGDLVIGIDNLDPYYDVSLKKARLQQLTPYENFSFHLMDITDQEAVRALIQNLPDLTHIIHLAAQAGVRYSLTHPFAYTQANIVGHLTLLEACRHLPLRHFVYASSSSVYGATPHLPFTLEDPADKPMSIYAATKRCQELMSYAYSHLFKVPCTGLRFFTVYGPWGRPDMAAFLFTQALFEEKEFSVFNQGRMRRNFTYIDDIVHGILGCLECEPSPLDPPYKIYNLGNNRSETLLDFIQTLEEVTGKTALMKLEPLQPGDVPETIADISASQRDFGFTPRTHIREGLQAFVRWYKEYYLSTPRSPSVG